MTADELVGVSLGVATLARTYDEALHRKDQCRVDRQANARLYSRIGETSVHSTALENRRFLSREVKHLADPCGARQFLDIGSGLPTMRNTQQNALQSNPDRPRRLRRLRPDRRHTDTHCSPTPRSDRGRAPGKQHSKVQPPPWRSAPRAKSGTGSTATNS
ncbi:SAM-dependent methyltransferase [Catenulispora acidiphila]|uniref:SAM-dependent methyltransferase n=1 Tax=Catenulispora acidiphila TaxID=304895 RepID=UPI000A05C609